MRAALPDRRRRGVAAQRYTHRISIDEASREYEANSSQPADQDLLLSGQLLQVHLRDPKELWAQVDVC